ncbi:MAG TPA: DinB family protein [Saprospiraceae bacterium]|nr:DinB family protein [Saprospiraceae bacterium]
MTLLLDYVSYNRWANALMADWLKDQPADLLHQEVASSFPSLHLTLLHLWSAEHIWLERLRGQPTTPFLAQVFQGSTKELIAGWQSTSQELEDYVRQLSAADLDFVQAFRLLNGNPDARSRAHMIQHCLNHATYHRGQLVTMGRMLGLTAPPATDFIAYLRSL